MGDIILHIFVLSWTKNGNVCVFKSRFKFDDDKVTPATVNDVFEHNFGGDYPFTKPGHKARRMTNAYMLVYILESERLEILRPITLDDMPKHICIIYIFKGISEKN